MRSAVSRYSCHTSPIDSFPGQSCFAAIVSRTLSCVFDHCSHFYTVLLLIIKILKQLGRDFLATTISFHFRTRDRAINNLATAFFFSSPRFASAAVLPDLFMLSVSAVVLHTIYTTYTYICGVYVPY